MSFCLRPTADRPCLPVAVFLKKWPFPASFPLYLSLQHRFNAVNSKKLPMSRFELRITGVRSNCSTNWATTTDPCLCCSSSVFRTPFGFTKIQFTIQVNFQPNVKNGSSRVVWPDWAIYWTLGNFSKPVAAISLPKTLTFLGNFCKGVKLFNFSSEIIFRPLL